MQLQVECLGLGKGVRAVELCVGNSAGGSTGGHSSGPEWAAAW